MTTALLSNEWGTAELQEKTSNFLETNENEHPTQNLWHAAEALLRGKVVALQTYFRKEGKLQIDSPHKLKNEKTVTKKTAEQVNKRN